MDQQTFEKSVAVALEHLYDLPYLQVHPLGQILIDDPGREGRGRILQGILRDAVNALKPSAEPAALPHAWRTYRYLFLRYWQALTPQEVASQLGISERQARRTYREAHDALSSLLWDRYLKTARSMPGRAEQAREVSASRSSGGDSQLGADGDVLGAELGADGDGDVVRQHGSVLEQEVDRLAAGARGETAELGEVIGGLRGIVDGLARQHGCELEVDLETPLPLLAAGRVVVRQIVLGLCAVSLEQAAGRLRLSVNSDPEGVRIGICFPVAGAEASPEVVATAENRLAVGRRLLESVHGGLRVNPIRGGSLSIEARLPRASRPTVLVIDDNPDILAVFRRYLETAGLQVVGATTGEEGLRVAQEIVPSAITLDVMMPGQDGWETLQQLRNDPATHNVPVIVCSVLRQEEMARFLGASALLPKPVTRPVLLEALARCGLPVAPGGYRSRP